MHLNLASLKSVRSFADTFLKTEPRLDILINNAGEDVKIQRLKWFGLLGDGGYHQGNRHLAVRQTQEAWSVPSFGTSQAPEAGVNKFFRCSGCSGAIFLLTFKKLEVKD